MAVPRRLCSPETRVSQPRLERTYRTVGLKSRGRALERCGEGQYSLVGVGQGQLRADMRRYRGGNRGGQGGGGEQACSVKENRTLALRRLNERYRRRGKKGI